MDQRKQLILDALSAFIYQRAGMESANYGCGIDGWRAYRSEQRSVTRDLHHARTLLAAVRWRDSITADHILAASKSAYSGRLEITEKDGGFRIDYCTGQYFPTEYRRAVCAVLASCLWYWVRDNAMPEKEYRVNGSRGKYGVFPTMEQAQKHANTYLPAIVAIEEQYQGKNGGQWLRDHFKREFGRTIQDRWFS